jgi:hypothetical protein
VATPHAVLSLPLLRRRIGLSTITGTASSGNARALKLALAIFALGATTPVAAQQRGTVMASIKGECTKFVVSGQAYGCKGVLYMGLPNGRVTFTVAMPNGAMTFSGGKDSQLDPTRYVLEVDTIRAGRANGRSDGYKAKGRCTMNTSIDGSIVHDLSCEASNGLQDVVLEFKGDGSPLDIDKF